VRPQPDALRSMFVLEILQKTKALEQILFLAADERIEKIASEALRPIDISQIQETP